MFAIRFFGKRVSFKCSFLKKVFPDIIWIESLWTVDSRIIFNNTQNFSSIIMNEFRGPVANITESLYYESFIFKSFC